MSLISYLGVVPAVVAVAAGIAVAYMALRGAAEALKHEGSHHA